MNREELIAKRVAAMRAAGAGTMQVSPRAMAWLRAHGYGPQLAAVIDAMAEYVAERKATTNYSAKSADALEALIAKQRIRLERATAALANKRNGTNG